MLNKRGLNLLQTNTCFLLIFLLFGCANRQNPTGGPRDRTPPKLLKATPLNNTRNFTGKTIILDFDEFFKVSSQEISVTPIFTKTPEYKTRKKSLIIDLKDTLEKNTTYVINFGKSIVDVNEGNVLKNFTYVFSTGPHIDSLSISGNVINNETQEKEKDATVMLLTLKQDSLLFGKKRPTVYTTTDSLGNFTLNNLHPGTYRIYALLEKTPDKIYNNENELIAFLKKDIHLTRDTSYIKLKLFKQEPEKFRLVIRQFDQDGKMIFTFNKKLNNPSLRIIYPEALNAQKIVAFSKSKDTATIFMKKMDFDSIRIAFFDDGKALDSASLRKGKKESFQRNLFLNYSLSADAKLKPTIPFTIKATYPITTFDPNLISLKEDSTDVNNFSLERDTADSRLFTVKYRWKQKLNYTLTFEAGAFTDIYGDKNKRAVKPFNLDKEQNYSQLTISVTLSDTGKSYIVELLNEQKTLIRSTVIHENTSIVYKNFITGKYRVRVVYDDNNNGKWDSGNIKSRRQPENIWVSQEIITLRPNWEQQTNITVPKEPATY